MESVFSINSFNESIVIIKRYTSVQVRFWMESMGQEFDDWSLVAVKVSSVSSSSAVS